MKKDDSIWKIRLKAGDSVSVNISEKDVEEGLKSISKIIETIASSCVKTAFDQYSEETVKKIFQEMDNKNEFYKNPVSDEINKIVEGNERIANMPLDMYNLSKEILSEEVNYIANKTTYAKKKLEWILYKFALESIKSKVKQYK